MKEVFVGMEKEGVNLLGQMLTLDPSKRITFEGRTDASLLHAGGSDDAT